MFRHDDLEILLSIFFTINDTIFVHPKFWSFEEFTVLDNVCYLAKNVWDMFANAIMVTHQKNHITYVCMYVCMYKVDTVGQIIWNKHINFKLQPT